MWLLSTDRIELHFFNTPESVPGGYAILSHVWDNKEQTFQAIQVLRRRWKLHEPRSRVSSKIKRCCKLAQRHGYAWVWIDTCCIDKTSSSDLSEAINSMFRYYALSQVCYAYLRDVPSDCTVQEMFSEFWMSVWHERGWTLQELLAPRLVIFLSRDWEVLGTKAELAGVLERITGIPRSVLRLEEDLEGISVASRMSWAAKRKTTRPEDEAYSLMGIFGINMPTLYGEGKNAFQRLQEEIMKQSPDTALFSWGACWHEEDMELQDAHEHSDHSYLFARSPAAFSECHESYYIPFRIKPKSPQSTGQDPVGIPTFSITPYGVLARVPLVEVSGLTVAVFPWYRDGNRLGLLLTPCQDSMDPSHQLYDTGVGLGFNSGGDIAFCRVIELGGADEPLQFLHVPVAAEWKHIYIAHRPPPQLASTNVAPLYLNRSVSTAFRMSEENLRSLVVSGFSLAKQSPIPSPWTGSPGAMLFFTAEGLGNRPRKPLAFVVHLGRCVPPSSFTSDTGSNKPGAHWAYVEHYHPGEKEPDPQRLAWHECPADHIRGWPENTMSFDVSCGCSDGVGVAGSTDGYSEVLGTVLQVKLSFTPCKLNPQETFVLTARVEDGSTRSSSPSRAIMYQAAGHSRLYDQIARIAALLK